MLWWVFYQWSYSLPVLNACICYNRRHAGFLSPSPRQCPSALASALCTHKNEKALVTFWQRPGQHTEAKCPPQEELPILWKGFELTATGLYLSFHWTKQSVFAWQLVRGCGMLHLQSFLHTDHQQATTGTTWVRSSRHFLPPGQTKPAAAAVNWAKYPKPMFFKGCKLYRSTTSHLYLASCCRQTVMSKSCIFLVIMAPKSSHPFSG